MPFRSGASGSILPVRERLLTSSAPASEPESGGAQDRRTQRATTKAPPAGGLGPGADAQGRARGLERPGLREPLGTPRPPPLPPGGASSLPPPEAGTRWPCSCGRSDPRAAAPAQPPPLHAPSYLGRGAGQGPEARSRARGARAPRSPERGGGGGGGFPSFLQLFLLRPRWLQTALLPLAPCPPLPEPAGLGSACDGERSGAGGSRAAALTASSAGRARGGGGDSAWRARGRPGRRGSGGSGSGSGAGAVVAAAAAPRL